MLDPINRYDRGEEPCWGPVWNSDISPVPTQPLCHPLFCFIRSHFCLRPVSVSQMPVETLENTAVLHTTPTVPLLVTAEFI